MSAGSIHPFVPLSVDCINALNGFRCFVDRLFVANGQKTYQILVAIRCLFRILGLKFTIEDSLPLRKGRKVTICSISHYERI